MEYAAVGRTVAALYRTVASPGNMVHMRDVKECL